MRSHHTIFHAKISRRQDYYDSMQEYFYSRLIRELNEPKERPKIRCQQMDQLAFHVTCFRKSSNFCIEYGYSIFSTASSSESVFPAVAKISSLIWSTLFSLWYLDHTKRTQGATLSGSHMQRTARSDTIQVQPCLFSTCKCTICIPTHTLAWQGMPSRTCRRLNRVPERI